MEEMQTIAEIPQDLTGSLGHVLASDVHMIIGQRKKKGSEFALAVDRQGVNIYNVRQSRLITSYAVSPQAVFTCPPASLRVQSTARLPAQRLTFCSLESPKRRLLCFSETLNPELAGSGRITTSILDLPGNGSGIVHLEALVAVSNDQYNLGNIQLLAVKQNGEAICYHGSLDKEIWSIGAGSTIDGQVLHVNITSVAQLRKGLLKHREDVLALFGKNEEEEQSNVLIQVTRVMEPNHMKKNATLVLRMFKFGMTPDANGLGGVFPSKPQEVVSIDVPEVESAKKQESTFGLHVASGTLYQQTPDTVTVYDFTGLLPKIAHEMALKEADVTSCLRLSPFSLAISRQSSFSLIGIPYCSIQAAIRLDSLPADEQDTLRLLSYFSSLGIIIAIKGRRLMAIRLLDISSKSGASRKRKREGTLADSIGRGSLSAVPVRMIDEASTYPVKILGQLLTKSKGQDWESEETKLDALISNGALESFSNIVLHDLEDGANPLDPREVSHLINTFFDVKRDTLATSNNLGLKIKLPSGDTIFSWLLKKHFLSADRIENALNQSGSLMWSEKLGPGALIDAIAKVDPSLRLLTSFVASQIPLSPLELAIALEAMIQQWDGKGPLQNPKPLKNTKPRSKPTKSKKKTHHNLPERTLSTTTTTSTTATTTATPSPHHLLHHILSRLSRLPQNNITSALRTHLPTPHLLHLTNLLRLEIAHAGWLSPYDDTLTPLTANTTSTPNNHLSQILHLLNSTIDAIGTAGWILGSSGPRSNTTTNNVINTKSNEDDAMMMVTTDPLETISHMKAEISAALEGIEEAVYLKGMLSEVLLCGKESLVTTKKPPKTMARSNMLEKSGSSASALPLGLRLVDVNGGERKVGLKKVGAGGELIVRSKREIGRLKSQMVGRYAFERVVV